jgi:hypothetical protein
MRTYLGVRLRLIGRDVVPPELSTLRPAQDRQTDQLGAVIGTIMSGVRRTALMASSSRAISAPESDVSTTSARFSRVKSFTTARMRINRRPASNRLLDENGTES